MKKIGYLIVTGLLVCGLSASNAGTDKLKVSKKNELSKRPSVGKKQVASMQTFATDFIDAVKNVSGPQELFKLVNGEYRTTSREVPITGAINSIIAAKCSIVCYEEGSNEIVASTDPALLGKSVDNFKTIDGLTVRETAISELSKAKDHRAIFTYETSPGKTIVNGEAVTQKVVVSAIGRRAFENLQGSEKRFIVLIFGEIDN